MRWAILVYLTILLPSIAHAGNADSARLLCATIKGTGDLVGECRFSEKHHTVSAMINIVDADVRTACFGMIVGLQRHGIHFTGKTWALQIRTRRSHGKIIMSCPLPG